MYVAGCRHIACNHVVERRLADASAIITSRIEIPVMMMAIWRICMSILSDDALRLDQRHGLVIPVVNSVSSYLSGARYLT